MDQILRPLRAHGLLVSVRGRSGGYRLARPAEEISLLDIVHAMEGKFQLVNCLADPKECRRASKCVTRDVWAMLSNNLMRDMKSVNLADLAIKQNQMEESPSNYAI